MTESIAKIEALRNRMASGEQTTFSFDDMRLVLNWADHLNYFLSREKQEKAALLSHIPSGETTEDAKSWLVEHVRAVLNDKTLRNRFFIAMCGMWPTGLAADVVEFILESADRRITHAASGSMKPVTHPVHLINRIRKAISDPVETIPVLVNLLDEARITLEKLSPVRSPISSEEAHTAAIKECIDAINTESGRVYATSSDSWRGGMFHAAETLRGIASKRGMAAFGASDAAHIFYPGAYQAKLRVAFMRGAEFNREIRPDANRCDA